MIVEWEAVCLETWKILLKNWIRVKFFVQDLSDCFGAKNLTSHAESFHIVCSRMSPLNWTIRMDLFSLLYGERPKLNQHWVLGKKTSRRRRPWLRSETGKNKIYRSKTVRTVSAEGHPKSADDVRLFYLFFFFKLYRDRKRWPDSLDTISYFKISKIKQIFWLVLVEQSPDRS